MSINQAEADIQPHAKKQLIKFILELLHANLWLFFFSASEFCVFLSMNSSTADIYIFTPVELHSPTAPNTQSELFPDGSLVSVLRSEQPLHCWDEQDGRQEADYCQGMLPSSQALINSLSKTHLTPRANKWGSTYAYLLLHSASSQCSKKGNRKITK